MLQGDRWAAIQPHGGPCAQRHPASVADSFSREDIADTETTGEYLGEMAEYEEMLARTNIIGRGLGVARGMIGHFVDELKRGAG
ncbi:MAG: hypothetical protein WCK05_08770 [Planctomycetota bacterium]